MKAAGCGNNSAKGKIVALLWPLFPTSRHSNYFLR